MLLDAISCSSGENSTPTMGGHQQDPALARAEIDEAELAQILVEAAEQRVDEQPG
jgi:hypothetical protein